MLIDYIKDLDLIRCKEKCTDWEDVVRKGIKLLTDEKFTLSSYADSIIEMTKEHGPYYAICPRVALPHSRPENGVLKKGISIMTLEEPINFGSQDNDPISLVICLAATDNESHLLMMQDMVELLSDEKNIDNLINANSVEEIKDILS